MNWGLGCEWRFLKCVHAPNAKCPKERNICVQVNGLFLLALLMRISL